MSYKGGGGRPLTHTHTPLVGGPRDWVAVGKMNIVPLAELPSGSYVVSLNNFGTFALIESYGTDVE